MTDDVKKVAEEYHTKIWEASPPGAQSYSLKKERVGAFLAGDAHGFARAVKMLGSADAFQFYCGETHEGPGVRPHEWAKWLEEQEKGKG